MANTAPKKKTATGGRNDSRSNGKAWKQGKSPEVREKERRAKMDDSPEAVTRRARKAEEKAKHRVRRGNLGELREMRKAEEKKAAAKKKLVDKAAKENVKAIHHVHKD